MMSGSRTQLRQEIESDLAELKAQHAVSKKEGAYTPAGEREVDLALANVERLLRANKLKGARSWLGVVTEEMIKAYSLRDNPSRSRSKSGPVVNRAVMTALERASLYGLIEDHYDFVNNVHQDTRSFSVSELKKAARALGASSTGQNRRDVVRALADAYATRGPTENPPSGAAENPPTSTIRYRVSRKRGGLTVQAFDGSKKVGNLVATESLRFYDVTASEVLPDYRGQGIGRQMYLEAHTEACSLGKPLRSQHYQRSPSATRVWKALDAIRTPDEYVLECGMVQNPPYSGYRPGWTRRKLPKDLYRACYRTKSDALNVFLTHNYQVVEDYGGPDMVHSPASFDAINHRFDLRGKRRVDNIAKAAWWALSGPGPWCLEDIDIDLLNQTAPVIYNQSGHEFRLPDHLEEQRLIQAEHEWYQAQYPEYEAA